MQREVDFSDGYGGRVSLNEPVLRHPGNPIRSARDVNEVWLEPHRRVVTVHNAGAARLGDEIVLLFRSHRAVV